jgi:hypothetical protein
LAGKSLISKSDLEKSIQDSLGRADTAIQSIKGLATETYVDDAIRKLPTPDVSG